MSQTAPCNWPLATECCPKWDEMGAELQSRAASWATEILWMLSGRIFGLCEVTVRPCAARCAVPQGTTYQGFAGNAMIGSGMVGLWTPSLIDGAWVNCSCMSDCCTVCDLDLPFGPASEIVSIQIDGAVLEPRHLADPNNLESESLATYRIDSYDRLVRLDGGCWPTCQDLSLPLTEEGTWAITYNFGVPVPVAGQVAAAELACEFAKACEGDSTCKLPSRVQSITRQGVTMTMLDTLSDLWQTGRTGLFNVDLWLSAVNPHGLRERGAVYTPELLRQRRRARKGLTTWSPPAPEATP